MNEIHKTTKFVFEIVGAVLLAMLLYQLFFGSERSAMRFACESIETPISFYYYQYAYYPSIHNLDGVSSNINSSIVTSDITDITTDSATDGLHNTDNASNCASYTTGWY